MKTFDCSCGNTLFFGSRQCVKCGHSVGVCIACQSITDFVPADKSTMQCNNCHSMVLPCVNSSVYTVCNRHVPVPVGATGETSTQLPLCDYCQLTTVVPDLTMQENQERWWRLERAKQRVLFVLEQVGFPLLPNQGLSDSPRLSFEFKTDGEQPVLTGHASGVITINLKEADDVAREMARVQFGEPHRTLVGHFRHELGHFVWDKLVKDRCVEKFRALFGDEREPSYDQAMKQYYANGPKANWQANFVAAYASMHPWEDFAETFGTYADMVSVLMTAEHFDLVLPKSHSLEDMLTAYRTIGLVSNELNRDMGLKDLVPEVFVPPVTKKLQFIHQLRHQALAGNDQANTQPGRPSSQPATR